MNIIKRCTFILLLASPAAVLYADDSNTKVDEMLHSMEAHWQELIREQNPSKRQAMMKDHANMMMDIESINKGIPENKRVQRHHHSNNVIDMHHMMMETMGKF